MLLRPKIDTLTHNGAYELSEMIGQYWRKQGYHGFVATIEHDPKEQIFYIRSNIIRGFPPKKAPTG